MSLRLRLFAVLALVVGALAVLVPGWVRTEPLPLGVDLRGGSELRLDVDVDATVAAAVSDDAAFLEEQMAAPGAVVRQRALGSLEVVSDAPSAVVVGFVDDLLLGSYRHVGSDGRVHRFALSEERSGELQEQAVERAEGTIRDRVACMPMASVERVGPESLFVRLPGDVHLAPCP